MSRLININPDIHLDPEPEGQEKGYCILQESANASTIKAVAKANLDITEIIVVHNGPLVN